MANTENWRTIEKSDGIKVDELLPELNLAISNYAQKLC